MKHEPDAGFWQRTHCELQCDKSHLLDHEEAGFLHCEAAVRTEPSQQ